jgi:hypothetical protein
MIQNYRPGTIYALQKLIGRILKTYPSNYLKQFILYNQKKNKNKNTCSHFKSLQYYNFVRNIFQFV